MRGKALGLALTIAVSAVPGLGLNGAEVGVFSTGVWNPGLVALEHFLDWKGLTHERFSAGDVNTVNLADYYQAVVIPGGDPFGYDASINADGQAHLRDFVAEGGGYVGICGGGYYAADDGTFFGTPFDFPLDLFDGSAEGPLDGVSTMTTISLNQSDPINEYQPAFHVTMYSGGSAFYPNPSSWADTVGTYDEHDGDCAMINSYHGNGRVVLIGPHPELEEDSTRDGTPYGDQYDDQGSEWGLLWSAFDWVLGRAVSDSSGATSVVLEQGSVDDSFNGPGGICLDDLNDDGRTDVLAAGYSANEVAWWRNEGGEPVSWTKQTIESAFAGAIFAHAGDLDGDLDTDVAGAAWFLGEVAWWRNDGGEPIAWTKRTIDTAANAHEVFVCDLDEDGFYDVLAALAGNDAIVWYRNDGAADPGWTAYTISDSFAGARSARIADFDQDGDNDVVGASLDGNEVTWWENGGGEPIQWTEHTITNTFGGSHMVRVEDVDGDGDPDILAAAFAVNTIAWWRNDGGDPLSWTRQNIDAAFAGAVGVEPADIDGDGDTDVVGTAQPSDDIAWWRNDGGDPIMWKKKSISESFAQVWPLGAADIDGNGTVDIVAGGFEADEIRWWMNREDWLVPDFEARPPSGHAPLAVQFIDESCANPPPTWWRWDLDGDGTPDSEDRNPSWQYADPGTYAVTLQVSNGVYTETLVREDGVRVFDGESALLFDGISSRVVCETSSSLNLTDALTVEAWIDPTGWGKAGTAGYGRIVDKTSFALYVNGEGSTFNPHSLLFMVRTEGGPPAIGCTPDSTIALGVWQHVAATYDATTGEMSVYLDGIGQDLTSTSQPSGPIQDNAAYDLMVGNSTSGYAFDGVIDELRIWNAVRTEDEIAEHMHEYLQGSEQGLAGYWTMNEGYGPRIADGSENGNDGTIQGALWTQGHPGETTPADELPSGRRSPSSLALHPAHPNPFHPCTTMSFELPVTGQTSLTVYDVTGRFVRALVVGKMRAGRHTATWDGTDQAGKSLASGVYLIRLDAGGYTLGRRSVLAR
jgi:PKD repeat protein/putative intracellular protease/amidase